MSPSCYPRGKRAEKHEPTPLIVVEGFLGGAGAILWGDFKHFVNEDSGTRPRKVIFASAGPVSSLHDRACELYYTLRGGTVNYGMGHSRVHGHSQYGRTNTVGLYPQWSSQYPLHFFGHSMGGPTITKLQFLLQKGHFGPTGHPDMVLSIATISAPFRGTQLVYALGECTDAAPAVRSLSIGSFIAKWVHLVTFISPFLSWPLDLHAESRPLSHRELSFFAFCQQLWSSDWAESRDATPFDMTFEAVDERESSVEGYPHSNTFYKSYVASMTSSWATDLRSTPLLSLCATPLYFTSRSISSFDFTRLQPTPSFLDQATSLPTDASYSSTKIPNTMLGPATQGLDKDYWENDGIVPLFSQWHPFPCSLTKCKHRPFSVAVKNKKPEAGIWDVAQIEDANHVSIVPLWRGTLQQKVFWINIGDWLRRVDDTRGIRNELLS